MEKQDCLDRQKVGRIVEYIKSCGDFPYDTYDVIENIDGILDSFGVYDPLSRDEYLLLIDDLLEIAEDSEIAEADRWASLQLTCGQDSRLACDYRIPNFI